MTKTIASKREIDTTGKGDKLDAPLLERMITADQLENLRRRSAASSKADPQSSGSIRDFFAVSVPAGWKELPAAQFRDINFAVGPNGEASCYLTFLQGSAGGARSNVDRWRKQFGLAPISDADFSAMQHVTVLGRDSVLASFEGTMTAMEEPAKEGQAMVGVYAEFPAFGITVKFVGPKEIVAAERGNFDQFIRTLGFNQGAAAGAGTSGAESAPPAATPPAANSGAGSAPGIKWQVPSGWTVGSGSSMRLVTLDVPGGAQLWVTPLSGGAGGVKANLDRWRHEVGMAPLTEDEFNALPKLKILGVDTPWVDVSGAYKGMGGPTTLPAVARVFAAACAQPDSLVTIKMVGPPETLEKERSHFTAFCQSLEVAK